LNTQQMADDLRLRSKTSEPCRAQIGEKPLLADGVELLQQASEWVHQTREQTAQP
jgi:predicted amino acid dehydrogenase